MFWSGVDYCDVFIRLSFWRHPFTAKHPLLRKWCNATFLKTCSQVETNSHVIFTSKHTLLRSNYKCAITHIDLLSQWRSINISNTEESDTPQPTLWVSFWIYMWCCWREMSNPTHIRVRHMGQSPHSDELQSSKSNLNRRKIHCLLTTQTLGALIILTYGIKSDSNVCQASKIH